MQGSSAVRCTRRVTHLSCQHCPPLASTPTPPSLTLTSGVRRVRRLSEVPGMSLPRELPAIPPPFQPERPPSPHTTPNTHLWGAQGSSAVKGARHVTPPRAASTARPHLQSKCPPSPPTHSPLVCVECVGCQRCQARRSHASCQHRCRHLHAYGTRHSQKN